VRKMVDTLVNRSAYSTPSIYPKLYPFLLLLLHLSPFLDGHPHHQHNKTMSLLNSILKSTSQVSTFTILSSLVVEFDVTTYFVR